MAVFSLCGVKGKPGISFLHPAITGQSRDQQHACGLEAWLRRQRRTLRGVGFWLQIDARVDPLIDLDDLHPD